MVYPDSVNQPSCHGPTKKTDYLLWGSLSVVSVLYIMGYLLEFFPVESQIGSTVYQRLAISVFDLINTMWWGMLIGMFMVSILSKVPREFVISILGTESSVRGIVRATAAGVLLDLCSHGILMVGAKLYERGASIGQVMAFLIASPWNSFSLTLILIALIGVPWTLTFILLSMWIAIMVGLLFDVLVRMGVLPSNPNKVTLPEGFSIYASVKRGLKNTEYSGVLFKSMAMEGIQGSRMVIRWILFGVLLASLIRAFVPSDLFGAYFGPTLAGLGLTVLAATVIEVCSEGSTPIAADLLTRASAPGNSFAFLMTGVSTDYTEIMVLKDTTRSWKIALFMPLLTVPQVILIAWFLNGSL